MPHSASPFYSSHAPCLIFCLLKCAPWHRRHFWSVQNELPQHNVANLRLRCSVSIWILLPFSVLGLSRSFMHWPFFNFPCCATPARIHFVWPRSQPTAQTVTETLVLFSFVWESICKEKTNTSPQSVLLLTSILYYIISTWMNAYHYFLVLSHWGSF